MPARRNLATLAKRGQANFDMLKFVRAQTGPGGKVAAAMALQCSDVIDDRDDICKEAWQEAWELGPSRQRTRLMDVRRSCGRAVEGKEEVRERKQPLSRAAVERKETTLVKRAAVALKSLTKGQACCTAQAGSF